MKFMIMCTVHKCEVIMADNDINPLFGVPEIDNDQFAFEIAEDNLYCNFRHIGYTDGLEHNFRILPL